MQHFQTDVTQQAVTSYTSCLIVDGYMSWTLVVLHLGAEGLGDEDEHPCTTAAAATATTTTATTLF